MAKLEFIQLILITALFALICEMKTVNYALSKHLFFTFLFVCTLGFIVQLFVISRDRKA